MKLQNLIAEFKALPPSIQMTKWEDLARIGRQASTLDELDKSSAIQLVELIESVRSLMGSSKVFESATEIDVHLCSISLALARIGFANSLELKKHIEAALYYSSHYPQVFDKKSLEEELKQWNR